MVVLEPVTQEAVSAAAAAAAAAAVGLLDHPHPHHAHAQHPAVAPVPQETSAASAVSPVVSARSSMKILPKRFINLHQWLTPICPKQLKESLVSPPLTSRSHAQLIKAEARIPSSEQVQACICV